VILTASTSASRAPGLQVYSASKARVRNFAGAGTLDLKSADPRELHSPGRLRTPGLVDLPTPTQRKQQGLLDYMASTDPGSGSGR